MAVVGVSAQLFVSIFLFGLKKEEARTASAFDTGIATLVIMQLVRAFAAICLGFVASLSLQGCGSSEETTSAVTTVTTTGTGETVTATMTMTSTMTMTMTSTSTVVA